MSWFLVVHDGFKLVVWGSGDQHPHQLFNLTADPDEMSNLVSEPTMQSRISSMLSKMSSVVDYQTVAKNVAKYNQDSMKFWVNNTKNWPGVLGSKNLRWHESWKQSPKENVAAIQTWLAEPPQIHECRANQVWPPHTST